MAISYKRLWKLLIDKDIKKKDLSAKAGVSPATITKVFFLNILVNQEFPEFLITDGHMYSLRYNK